MKHKTIAEIAAQQIREVGADGVMWGDTHLLDDIGNRCTHTNLMKLHPLDRHQRILNALDKSKLFKKEYVDLRGYCKLSLVRSFRLIQD